MSTSLLSRRRRRTLERFGLAVVALLVTLMAGFLVVSWLRRVGHAALPYEQWLIAGQWADLYLGTNVFSHPMLRRSLATGVFVGVAAPLVGSFLIHRGMAMVGETLAHTAFAGVALAVLVRALTGWDGSPVAGAVVVAVCGALGVQWLAARTRAYGDVPIAIVLSGSFALGTLAISYARGRAPIAVDVESYLFGSVAVVGATGARVMGAITVVTVLVVAAFYKELTFIAFDEPAARVSGLPVGAYNTLLVAVTAVVVVGAMQVLGVILVAATLVVPVAAAAQVAGSFREAVALGVLFGEGAVLVGLALSIAWSLPAGGTIVVVAIGVYLLCVAVGRR